MILIPKKTYAQYMNLLKASNVSADLFQEHVKWLREIELKGNQATVKGSYLSLVGSIKFAVETKNLSTPKEVLRFNSDWRARTDSNGRQPGSK